MIQNDFQYIINHVEFVNTEILKTTEQRQARKDNLYLGLVLGTNYGKVVKITAHTFEGAQEYEGIILALTDHFVILKGGLKIPLVAIESMRIY